MEYTKAKALKRIALLKCVSGKTYRADKTVLIRMYKALIRPILDYAAVILDGPGNRSVDSLEYIQNTGLRIATGALRTSPVRSLQVDTHGFPLNTRRKELPLRYFLKVRGDRRHPCYKVVDSDTKYAHVYADLSERYMRRISGFPIAYRLNTKARELRLNLPAQIDRPKGTIPPWLIPDVITHMLFNAEKRQMSEIDIRVAFQEMISQYPGFRFFFTDGSKQNGQLDVRLL